MKRLFLMVFLAGFGTMLAHAENSVPQLINYQGKLTNGSGEPLATGEYSLTFKLWDHATDDGEEHLLWTESHAAVPVVRGYFNVVFGGVTTGISDALNGRDRFISIAIDGGTDLSPRQQLLSAPFALHAEKVVGNVTETISSELESVVEANSTEQPVSDLVVELTVSGNRPVFVGLVNRSPSRGFRSPSNPAQLEVVIKREETPISTTILGEEGNLYFPAGSIWTIDFPTSPGSTTYSISIKTIVADNPGGRLLPGMQLIALEL